MSPISKEDVVNLREKTGAGLIDCKRALADSNGDIEEAISILRTKGVASAAKKDNDEPTCSPPSCPMRPSAFDSVSWTFSSPLRRRSASRVRSANSCLSFETFVSISAISCSQDCKRLWQRSSSSSAALSSRVRGSIFSRTREYFMFAFTLDSLIKKPESRYER